MNENEYGFPDDEDVTDGPDLAQARAARDQTLQGTDEIAVILVESQRLVTTLREHGRKNHFVDKWKELITRSA